MDQNQQNKEELPDEERIAIEDALRPRIDKFLSKTYSILSWCWPATIAMFIGREVLRQFGYYGISNWVVTVFLWLPLAIVIGATTLFIGFFYLMSLIAAWGEFVRNVLLYFKLGYAAANKKENEEK